MRKLWISNNKTKKMMPNLKSLLIVTKQIKIKNYLHYLKNQKTNTHKKLMIKKKEKTIKIVINLSQIIVTKIVY